MSVFKLLSWEPKGGGDLAGGGGLAVATQSSCSPLCGTTAGPHDSVAKVKFLVFFPLRDNETTAGPPALLQLGGITTLQ